MQRIKDPTAAASLPAPPALTGTTGYFQGGTGATRVRYWVLNMFQEELMSILAAAGVTPDTTGTVFNQVVTAIETLITSAGGSFATTSALAAEIARAEGEESTLGTAISTETTRAEGEESTLGTAISTETTRAETAESGLSSDIATKVPLANMGTYFGTFNSGGGGTVSTTISFTPTFNGTVIINGSGLSDGTVAGATLTITGSSANQDSANGLGNLAIFTGIVTVTAGTPVTITAQISAAAGTTSNVAIYANLNPKT